MRLLRENVLVVILLISAGVGPAALHVSAQSPPPTPSGALRGHVIDEHGTGQSDIVVHLKGGDTTTRVVATDASGAFRFTGLVPGGYIVGALPPDRSASTSANVDITRGEVVRNLVLRPARPNARAGLLLTCVAGYLLLLMLFRHFNIARLTRELLQSQVQAVRTRLHLEADPAKATQLDELEKELKLVDARIPDWPLTELFFWSHGREIAMWRRVHEVERQFVSFMIPQQRVVECLFRAAAELKPDASPGAVALTARIAATLGELTRTGSDPAARPVDVEQIKQLLAEALAIIYADRDNKFAGLMEWHNKAMWLVAVSLIAIVVLGMVFHHEELFLIGAAGGLMSRMARTLFREDVPTDYGASWTTLFLSPLLGAIGAWFGIVLVIVLTRLGVLGDALLAVTWDGSLYTPLVIGLALVLGFSERFFMSLLSAVEGRVQSQLTKSATSSSSASASAAPMLVGLPPGRTAAAAGSASTAQATDLVVQQLDLKTGDRAAFVGDPASLSRQQLESLLGGGNVVTVETGQLPTVRPLHALLLEKLPDPAGLAAAAAAAFAALEPGGRLVIVGSTPAVSFVDSADAHQQRNHSGPALVHKRVTGAGFLAEEPPERLGGTDPVRWSAVFSKPDGRR